MLLNRIIIVCFLLINFNLFAEKLTPLNLEFDIISDIFSCLVENKIFNEQTQCYWTNEDKEFIENKVPFELKKYANKVSFTGEFLRFLRSKIIDNSTSKIKHIIMYKLNNDRLSIKFINDKQEFIRYIEAEKDSRILEFLIRLISVYKGRIDNKNRVYWEYNYIYVALVKMNDNSYKFLISPFLTNTNLPLQYNNGELLEKVDNEIWLDFQKWLFSQEEFYKMQK